MLKFLSDEWFIKVTELYKNSGDLKMPKIMTDLKVNLTVKAANAEVQMCLNGGIIQKGFLDNADVSMTMPAEYAYKLMVLNDWSVGMPGYIKKDISVSGNLKKLSPLQAYKPSRPSVEFYKKLAAFTDFKA